MFPTRLALTVLFTALIVTSARAESWADDDSWKTASPYYYGDSGPSVKSEPRYRSTRRAKPKKEITPFTPNSNNLSLDIGQNFLVGSDFQDAIGLQGTYTYGVSSLFAFTSSLGYSSHSEGNYSKMHLIAGPRLNLANFDRVIPYVNAGLGFYRASRALNSVNSISGTMFGLHFGGGADLQLTKETFFGAAMSYHQLFGTNQQTTIGPIDLASNYLTFMAHVGYTF